MTDVVTKADELRTAFRDNDLETLQRSSGSVRMLEIKSIRAFMIVALSEQYTLLPSWEGSSHFTYLDYEHIFSLSKFYFQNLLMSQALNAVRNPIVRGLIPSVEAQFFDVERKADSLLLFMVTSRKFISVGLRHVLQNTILRLHRESSLQSVLEHRKMQLLLEYLSVGPYTDLMILSALTKGDVDRLLTNNNQYSYLWVASQSSQRLRVDMSTVLVSFLMGRTKSNAADVLTFFEGRTRDIPQSNGDILVFMLRSGLKYPLSTWQLIIWHYLTRRRREVLYPIDMFVHLNFAALDPGKLAFLTQYIIRFPQRSRAIFKEIETYKPFEVAPGAPKAAETFLYHEYNLNLGAALETDIPYIDVFISTAMVHGASFYGLKDYLRFLPLTKDYIELKERDEEGKERALNLLRRGMRSWLHAKEFKLQCINQQNDISATEWSATPVQYRLKLHNTRWCFDVRDLLSVIETNLLPPPNGTSVRWPNNPYTRENFTITQLEQIKRCAVNSGAKKSPIIILFLAAIELNQIRIADFFSTTSVRSRLQSDLRGILTGS